MRLFIIDMDLYVELQEYGSDTPITFRANCMHSFYPTEDGEHTIVQWYADGESTTFDIPYKEFRDTLIRDAKDTDDYD